MRLVDQEGGEVRLRTPKQRSFLEVPGTYTLSTRSNTKYSYVTLDFRVLVEVFIIKQ